MKKITVISFRNFGNQIEAVYIVSGDGMTPIHKARMFDSDLSEMEIGFILNSEEVR
jgi:hypothetical protein